MDSPERKRYWKKAVIVHLPLLLSSTGMQLFLLLLWLLSFSCFFTFFPMWIQKPVTPQGSSRLSAPHSDCRDTTTFLNQAAAIWFSELYNPCVGAKLIPTHPHSVLLENPAHYIFPTGEIRGMALGPKWKSETSMKAEGGFLVRPMPRVFQDPVLEQWPVNSCKIFSESSNLMWYFTCPGTKRSS